jgi:hypothetical protein
MLKKTRLKFSIFLFAVAFYTAECSYLFWNNLNLEPSLLKFSVLSNSTLREKCARDKFCPVKLDDNLEDRCWGFEHDCQLSKSYSSEIIRCSGRSDWPGVVDKESHRQLFWRQADFGLLKEQFQSIQPICKSESQVINCFKSYSLFNIFRTDLFWNVQTICAFAKDEIYF